MKTAQKIFMTLAVGSMLLSSGCISFLPMSEWPVNRGGPLIQQQARVDPATTEVWGIDNHGPYHEKFQGFYRPQHNHYNGCGCH